MIKMVFPSRLQSVFMNSLVNVTYFFIGQESSRIGSYIIEQSVPTGDVIGHGGFKAGIANKTDN